ncbi:MAG: DNA-processing protein DprA [Clostridia bacterium]|nr:DNA-processing protein DprA [Clostridia bacterium]
MRTYTHEQVYRLALQCAHSLSWRQQQALLEAYGTAEAVLTRMDQGVRDIVGDKAFDELRGIRNMGARQLLDQLESAGAQMIFREDAEYPALLREIADPPHALFLRGSPAADERSVAIVGSRRDTRYGRTQAKKIARELAAAGITVVSGLARGIDTAAHEGALEAGGRTVAVLGNGIDTVYPEENRELARRIVDNGGAVITEFPFGAGPLAYHFPIRNRIISGISAALLLIEGHARSGTMITAGYAADQGREVFALPGAVDAPGSAAPLALLRDGAGICTCAQDILVDMGWAPKEARTEEIMLPEARLAALEGVRRSIAELMLNEPKSFEELAGESGIAPEELSAELTLMELDGVIEARAGRVYAL